jgi:C-terminal processing protease CtpA/Prc
VKQALRLWSIFALLVMGVFVIWRVAEYSAKRSGRKSPDHTLYSAATNPLAFARSRLTGGVGAILTVDPATGVPLVVSVIPGSPAEKAGLRAGDLVIKVNGVATRGRTLAENIESIRGFVMGNEELAIQRNGSTNRQLIIQRSSWKSLGVTNQ